MGDRMEGGSRGGGLFLRLDWWRRCGRVRLGRPRKKSGTSWTAAARWTRRTKMAVRLHVRRTVKDGREEGGEEMVGAIRGETMD